MAVATIKAGRPGWEVNPLVSDDVVTEHSTGHRRFAGHLRLSWHGGTRWSPQKFYFLSVCRPDAMYTGVAECRWQDGKLVLVPSRFRNGKVRPISKRTHPRPEDFAEAEHLIRALGWER